MFTVTQDEASKDLSLLIEKATVSGDEIVIMRGHTAIAKIVPISAAQESSQKDAALSLEAWNDLLQQTPSIPFDYPAPSIEALRREYLYED